MSVMLLDVWRAARARAVPFSGETAGYVTLAVCEAMGAAACCPTLTDVELAGDGSIHVNRGSVAVEPDAERALRALLARLLEVASSPGPALFRAAGRAPGGSVAVFGAELRQALIPCNRAAARRALLRLYRETERAVANGRLGPPPDHGDASALLRVSPPPPPSRELTPPVIPSLAVELPVPLPVPVLVTTPPPAVATAPAPDQLTRPETVVAFVKQGRTLPPLPPPLPKPREEVGRTPRMGSMDVDIVMGPRTPSPPPLLPTPDPTESAPVVFEPAANIEEAVLFEVEFADREQPPTSPADDEPALAVANDEPAACAMPSLAPTPLLDLCVRPILAVESKEPYESGTQRLPPVTLLPPRPLDDLIRETELTAEDVTEDALSEESPALAVGVHVQDSDELAEAVDDDDIETRPLRSTTIPAPYAGTPPEPSHVNELLQGFQVAGGLDERELRHELKALAGVDCTPGYAAAVRSR